MDRDKSIDIAKGIGIILMVWGHEVCPIYNQIYLFHVPLFIIISGILYNKKDSLSSYFNKKIQSLILPFFKYYFIGFIVWCIYNREQINSLNIIDVFKYENLFENGPIWFLISLFWINILYHIININKYYKIFFIIIITILGLHMIKIKVDYMFITPSLIMLFFYYFGDISKKMFLSYNVKLFIVFSSILIYGITLTLTNKYFCNIAALNIDGNIFLYYLFGISGSYVTIFLSKYISHLKYSYLLSRIGEKSLKILGLHFIFVRPINNLYHNIICNLFHNKILSLCIKTTYSLIMLFLTIFFIMLFTYIVEKKSSKNYNNNSQSQSRL